MTYKDMIVHSDNRSEEAMWESVDAVSELVERLKERHPKMAHDFVMKTYKIIHGGHFCEELAKEEVEEMWHTDANGEKVCGEIVGLEAAMCLVEGEEDADLLRWDAYVGANGFLHDLSRSGLSTRQVLEFAKEFWFDDDDFDGEESKVFWYYSNK